MSTLLGGDPDRTTPAFKVPLTPPQEPQRHGLAINGVISRLDNADGNPGLSSTRATGDKAAAVAGHNDSVTETRRSLPNRDCLQEPPTYSVTHRQIPAEPTISRRRSDHTGLTMRRASTEVGTADRQRQALKTYLNDGEKDWSQSPDFQQSAVLSPTLSEKLASPDLHHPSPRPLLPVVENQVLQNRSPSISDVSRRIGIDQQIDVKKRSRNLTIDVDLDKPLTDASNATGRPRAPRALSTPASIKSPGSTSGQEQRRYRTASKSEQNKPRNFSGSRNPPQSPIPSSIPVPPLSLSTYLQLELSSQRPSQLYIHRSSASSFPFESSRVKIERLLNFLLLPHQLESALWFGTLACLDSWLYTFTILPLRMVKSMYILGQSWTTNLIREVKFVASYVYSGSKRVYRRRRTRGQSAPTPLLRAGSENQAPPPPVDKVKARSGRMHRRMKSIPSLLQPDDKADILKGVLIIATCSILLRLDASRMYHWVRGQAAIKLYVIYNLLEFFDRLLSAIGQDILECLFSQEALERKADGHSKVFRPFWLLLLALAYCVCHATALFYQVVTLNVAVNSYSNALITLLMSNQFVEIKGTVFKKFEKENLFQLTCADVVERFQLWHMLMIIAARNIVETGIFNFSAPLLLPPVAIATPTASSSPNITQAAPPLSAAASLPRSFMIVPSMLSAVGSYVPTVSHVLGPFVIVLGSEMLIDWLKHAYINKFNNTKPVIYGRFLDILAKDYYTNAFGEQNLTKRLGLPVIPLCCLTIRAGYQTYQMFIASWGPPPSSSHAATLASLHQQYSATTVLPTSTASKIVRKMDELFNHLPAIISSAHVSSYFSTILAFLLVFLILLVVKLILGMGLLAFSRSRYESMKRREHSGNPSDYVEGGRRAGGWGVVEVDDDKRRIIYEDDPHGLQALKSREAKDRARKEHEKETGFNSEGLEKVKRYEMVAKRIW